jgi:hypothetical protein
MRDNIISYMDMCQREGSSLQRGMNFRLRGRHSVTLMSVTAVVKGTDVDQQRNLPKSVTLE